MGVPKVVLPPPPVVRGQVVKTIRPTVVKVLRTTAWTQEKAQKSYRQQHVRVIRQTGVWNQEVAQKSARVQHVKVLRVSAADQERDEKAYQAHYQVMRRVITKVRPAKVITKVRPAKVITKVVKAPPAHYKLVKGQK